MEKKDIVVLKYAPNPSFLQIVGIKDVKSEEFKVDLERKVWSFAYWRNIPIGKSRPVSRDYREGVIGVYSTQNIKI